MSQSQRGPKESLFSPILDGEERQRLWEELAAVREKIRLYSEAGNHPVHDSLELKKVDKGELLISGLPKELEKLHPSQNLITFVMGDVRYFAQLGRVHLDQGLLRASLPTKVFKVNRRANFRVSIPNSHTFVVSMLALNGETQERALHLRDLSFGGCCLFYPDDHCPLQIDDVIEMRLQLDSRMIVTTAGRIRYGRPANESQKGWLVGVQFDPSIAGGSGDLFSMVLSLYRRSQNYAEI